MIMQNNTNLNAHFWTQRYKTGQTGWDLGKVSPPLKAYIDQLKDKNTKILIPGAGNSYEAEYLFKNGFTNVFVADISKEPLLNFKKRIPEFPDKHLLHIDFFKIADRFELILEQTFFCALPVSKRADYAKRVHELLTPNGKIAGLLFTFELNDQGPPFGGSKEEYLTYFRPYFNIEILENCKNSIAPRQGNELFFKFSKKLIDEQK